MVIAVYPGTFDPITNGHTDIVTRAAKLFDKVYFAVAESTGKSTMFSTDERVATSGEVLSSISNVEVISFNTLITDLAREQQAKVIIRGLRAVSDFDYEFQMAGMNRQLHAEIETVFLTPAENLSYISSTLVREIASYQGDVNDFVHPAVAALLKSKLAR